MSASNHDSIYSKQQVNISDFAFNKQVAEVFDNMISRSVPGYKTVSYLSAIIASEHLQAGDYCYDLGCATGDTLYNIATVSNTPCHLIGIDNSQAMLDKCAQTLAAQQSNTTHSLICRDICQVNFQPSQVIIMNFTLQFIAPRQRQTILSKVYKSLLPGGILILAEKIILENANQQSLYESWHRAFKRAQGYSKLEIQQKREAIEQVLIPETIGQHRDRLQESGFTQINLACQFLNFVTFVATK